MWTVQLCYITDIYISSEEPCRSLQLCIMRIMKFLIEAKTLCIYHISLQCNSIQCRAESLKINSLGY